MYGSWVAIRASVYAEAGPNSVRRQLAGAEVALGNHWAASHGTAAQLHGLVLLRPPRLDRIVVTVPATDRGHADLAGIHRHRAALPAEHLTVVDGVLTTTVARTLVDLSRALSLRDGLVAIDAALHAGRVTRDELRVVVQRCRRWPWIRRAAHIVDIADPACESPLESVSRLFFLAHDMPQPLSQVTLRSRGRFLGRSDFWWEAQRLAGEADGLSKYTRPEVLRVEKLRQERIEAAGVRVVRWTWPDVDQPGPGRVLAARLRALLGIT